MGGMDAGPSSTAIYEMHFDGQVDKFITIYASDDTQAVRLATEPQMALLAIC